MYTEWLKCNLTTIFSYKIKKIIQIEKNIILYSKVLEYTEYKLKIYTFFKKPFYGGYYSGGSLLENIK